ncbi:MAG: DUF1275 domain-containing protein [Gemmatimonadaceae bacterium]|nr:DUF1275 domain-containing protein [Gemmatimonadaceae bacterium]
MTVSYIRSLTATRRAPRADLHLGGILAFVAGAANAGAFLAVGQYTSHMTGVVSAMADAVVLGHMPLVWLGLGSLLSFLAGAATTAVLVNFARRRDLASAFALPLILESALLLAFGLLGLQMRNLQTVVVPLTVVLLCFTMGLQNAVITKLSGAVIRTTHVTGIVTDLGIELGKLAYWNRSRRDPGFAVLADRERMRVLAALLVAFFGGGVLGAIGFGALGYSATIPLALGLLAIGLVPAIDDLRGR